MRPHRTSLLLAFGALAAALCAHTAAAATAPPPRVTAFASSFTAGQAGWLFFRAGDTSGRATVSLGVFDDERQVWTKVLPHVRTDTGVMYSSTWTPRTRGTYQFCLLATDRAGHESHTSCALVRVG